MSDAEQFDVFYAEARDRLLVQAFALTGDLPASRGAVRDSFIAAWHRWPKLRRLDDPESWVRPHVLTHAQRRHTARIFHRDRKLDPELRATLDALHKLPVTSRKALLLADLSAASRAGARPRGRAPARGGGAPPAGRAGAVRRPPRGAGHRDPVDPRSGSRSTAPTSAGSAPRSSAAPAPRRRRTHALAGAALVTATLVVSGFVVVDAHGVRPTLESARDRITSVPGQSPSDSPTTVASAVTTASLLTKGAGLARRAGPHLARDRHRPHAAQHAALPASHVRRPEGDDGAGPQLHEPARAGQAPARGGADHGVLPRRRRGDPGLRHDDRLVRRVHHAADPAAVRTPGGPARRRGAAVRAPGVARARHDVRPRGRPHRTGQHRRADAHHGLHRARPGRQPAAPGLRGRRRLPAPRPAVTARRCRRRCRSPLPRPASCR